MKLSIAWIFDHIDADWKKQDIDHLVTKFNQITAEIEDYYEVNYDLKPFAIGIVLTDLSLNVPEWKKDIKLPPRKVKVGGCYLVKKDGWATCKDFGLDKDSSYKDGYLPEFDLEKADIAGGWKDKVETRDIILDVDNKSVTHRPDMWGHRGFAREVAAILDLPFISKEKFLKKHKVIEFNNKSNGEFVIENKSEVCNRFAGLMFPKIENKPSDLFMSFRLLKVGSRSINALVDITNYLMLDWSQPTHVFDADKIDGKKIIIRMAKNKEKLTLLDEREIELTNEDLVISDAKKAIALAGVMGGLNDSVSDSTKSIFLESANFDATFIRRTALRHKARTEASARFEKTLDPNQNIDGILRFLKLADSIRLKYSVDDNIYSIGKPFGSMVLDVKHEYLEKRAGFKLSEEEVVKPLTKIGFKLSKSDGVYKIDVPSFRGAKDIEGKEDILEEVIRFYGFNKITQEFPAFVNMPYDMTALSRGRKIKSYFANSGMIEQQNYAFFDESFLKEINYNPKNTIDISNPISENYTRLITSLVPGLLKNIKDNYVTSEKLYFFELARTWESKTQESKTQESKALETKSLAGVFFNKRDNVDFYCCKEKLNKFFRSLGFDVKWEKAKSVDPWFNPYQTANLMASGKKVGVAGKMDLKFLSQMDVLPESDGFIFELDSDFLLSHVEDVHKFEPITKYQEVDFDLSALVPLTVAVEQIESSLSKVDALVVNVELIDMFEKDSWKDVRSLTYNVRLSSLTHTLEKEEIEGVRVKSIKVLEKLGATLRT